MNEVSKLIDRTITEVKIDKSLTAIGYGSFSYCDSLNELHFTNPTPPTIEARPWYGLKYVYVPEGSIEAYRKAFSGKIYLSQSGGTVFDPSTFVFAYQVPSWAIQSFECDVDETGVKTGMATVVEKDINPSSPSYNQTRSRTYEDERCSSTQSFTKITSLDEATSGKYLIVNTSVRKALKASLIKDTTAAGDGINANNNVIDVTIENDTIETDVNTLNAAVDYDAENSTLSWTDSDTGTVYYISYNGSGAYFQYDSLQASKNPMLPKSIYNGFSFGAEARSIGWNSTRFRFYLPTQSQYFNHLALFKLN